jgi:hypothetical protein
MHICMVGPTRDIVLEQSPQTVINTFTLRSIYLLSSRDLYRKAATSRVVLVLPLY